MAYQIPTTQEIVNQNLTGLEGNIAQTSPLNDAAFLRVLAVIEALQATGLYKYAAERARQNLALTASDLDLDRIGANEGVYRKPAEAARLTATIPATNGLSVGLTATFTGDGNGVRYLINSSTIASDDYCTISVTADQTGTVGNMDESGTLTIVSQQAGIGGVATVTVVENTGAERETDEQYRQRILFAMRSTPGGGNATDYKIWAEGIAGVVRAWPYAGKPVSEVGDSYPGDRCVFVECDTTINADGIPPTALLDEVRAALTINPETGKSRPALGQTDETLWVEPITRSVINVTVTNLSASAEIEATVRDDIEAALAAYLPLLAPYVDGVDLPQDRNDRVTTPALSDVVQGILSAAGASAASVTFTVDATPYNSYQLSQGELVKLGTVTYATV